MGFGSGYSSRTVRGGKSYNNSMTAHVWNAGEEREGQSSNGNLYFRGAAIYSYGSHFVIAYRMPDNVVFLNADSYSVSTSGHQSDVRSAVSDRRTVSVASLSDIAGEWKLLPRIADFLAIVAQRGATADERKAIQANVRAGLLAHADALAAEIYAPGASRYSWDDDAGKSVTLPGGEEAGAYLAALVGLPLATWPKIKRDADKAKAKAAATKAADDRKAAEGRALRLADMSPRDFRDALNRASDAYNADSLRSYGKELKRARSLMIAATSGKLAAASRLATVRARIKMTAAYIDSFDTRHATRSASERERRNLAIVRNWRDAKDLSGVNAYMLRDLSDAAEWLALHGRTAKLRESADKLRDAAHIGRVAIDAEATRLAAIAAAEREAERERAKLAMAERIALWIAGERVGAIRFDSDHGGAALRVMGDTLETSHGASVPLAHAVKVFRFVKLCRDKGETWRRNGKTVRVGHFQVDRVDCTGDFTAGCHFITWQEVERVAKLAGVFECPASADALEPSALAA